MIGEMNHNKSCINLWKMTRWQTNKPGFVTLTSATTDDSRWSTSCAKYFFMHRLVSVRLCNWHHVTRVVHKTTLLYFPHYYAHVISVVNWCLHTSNLQLCGKMHVRLVLDYLCSQLSGKLMEIICGKSNNKEIVIWFSI